MHDILSLARKNDHENDSGKPVVVCPESGYSISIF
jgi:hypothetical protein